MAHPPVPGDRGPSVSLTPPPAQTPASVQVSEAHRRHWQSNLRLTAVLLAVWFGVTFGVSYFARELSFRFFGWPFSFWMAAQGSLIVFCFIVVVYARWMARLDVEHDVAEEP